LTKRLIVTGITFIFSLTSILSGCGPASPTPTPAIALTATSTVTRTLTSTPTFTPTPTATSTPNPVISQGDPGRIVELIRLGKGMIGEAVWSPDGNAIVVPRSTGIFRLNATTLEELTPIETVAPAYHLDVSPDGTLIASTIGRNDESILLWRVSDGSQVRSFVAPEIPIEGEDPPATRKASGFRNIQFSPDGKILAALCDGDRKIHLWNTADGKHLQTIEVWKGFSSFTFSTDGETLITGNLDGVVRSYGVADGKLRKTFTQSGDFPTLSPDGATLALSFGQDVVLMRMTDGAYLHKLKGSKYGIYCLDFSPDGKLLAGLSYYGGLYLWNIADGKLLNKAEPQGYIDTSHSVDAPGDWTWTPRSISFSPDGSSLLQQAGDNSVRIIKVQEWSITGEYEDVSYPSDGMAFLKNGNSIELIRHYHLAEYNIVTGELTGEADLPPGFGAPLAVFSSDGSLAASGCWQNNSFYACVWKPADNSIKTLNYSGGSLIGLDLSSDGRILAAARYPEEITRLWSVDEGKPLRTFPGFRDPKFSPDGSMIALQEKWVPLPSGGISVKNTVHIFEISGGKEVGLINPDRSVEVKVFSPDGKILAVGGFGQKTGFSLWHVPDGDLIRVLEYQWNVTMMRGNYPTAVAFSPDGKIVAAGDGFGVIRIWRMEDGTLIKELNNHFYKILWLSFSADGMRLASSSADGTVRIWGILR